MSEKMLTGEVFLRMLSGGVSNLKINSKTIDDLNVFPVPDGDTGSNMMRTFETGFLEAKDFFDENASNSEVILGDLAKKLSHGMLLGARGNSGVILSQIFKGIQLGLQNCEEANVEQLIKAYEQGVQQSYHAVVNPVEGTILTVFREATEYAKSKICSDHEAGKENCIEDFYKYHLEGAKIILPKTKEMLPVLAEADVIDSGGAGYLCILEGMFNALMNRDFVPEIMNYDDKAENNSAPKVDISAFTRDSVLEFGYCTECLLRLQSSKVKDIDAFDIKVIVDFLNSIGGDSVVAYKEDDIVKLHVHTENPGTVLNEMRKYGEFLTVKIENMSLQHQQLISEGANDKKNTKALAEHKNIAVVTVADGDGLKKIFSDFGADQIVDGGQTGNPSTADFIEAFNSLNADNIVVLPNNSNIILTAKQAAELYKDSKIFIIPTKSIQQGFSAMAILNPLAEDAEAMVAEVTDYIQEVISCDVALAVRDAELSGKSIKEGDYIGVSGDDVLSVGKDKLETLEKLLDELDQDVLADRELLTLFCGKDVSEEEAETAENLLAKKYSGLDVSRYDGGQKVYSFLVGIE
ncbi:MAG: DAK2 domain-containing protein [Treponema sp.]|nr:DAK2 domain-containing protein [Treponema sp.]